MVGVYVIIIVAVVVIAIVLLCLQRYKLRSLSNLEFVWDDVCGLTPLVFLSHHKGACGDIARLIKMLLNIACASEIFLDSGAIRRSTNVVVAISHM